MHLQLNRQPLEHSTVTIQSKSTRTAEGHVAPPGTFAGFRTKDAPQDEDLYKCVHCGFCLSACPTYLETGLEAESPRGRIALMKAVREGRLEITKQVLGHWDMCLQCRACEVACPSGVPYGRLMEGTRAEVAAHIKRPLTERMGRAVGYRGLLANPGQLRMAGRAVRLYQRTPLRVIARGTGLLKILPGGLDHLDRTMPHIGNKFFVADGRVIPAIGARRARVAMLAGCVMTLMHSPALEAATRVLARNGVEVVLTAGQGCCGALNTHAGERESAREMARRNIDSFLAASPDAIIVASAGCGSSMKEYGDLLHSDTGYGEKAEKASKLTRDIHEFLASLPLIPPRAGASFESIKKAGTPATAPLRVTYQDACHLVSAQRIKNAPRDLLCAIPGVELVEMPESAICCGSAGTYSITQKEMSQRLGRRKAQNVLSVQPDVVATGNPGCALQLENYLRDLTAKDKTARQPQVRYVVELLDEAYRSEEETLYAQQAGGQDQ